MSLQTCTNPVTRESTDCLVPNLLGSSLVDEEDDLPPPFNPPKLAIPPGSGVNPEANSTPADDSTAMSTPTNCSGASKRKSTSKDVICSPCCLILWSLTPRDAFEEERLKLAKLDTEIKRQNTEMEKIRAHIEFIERLKNLGHTQEEIAKFFAEQFSKSHGGSDHPIFQEQSDDESSKGSDNS
ncbi:uncharacterized protein VP01_315g7 [Puccinia sorghi]|uniref:No apical meristem-associated C-terminal domain-containing protein n=1 Tax=Puccinia sorghi TaxID=27349 RepID=A0A0L6UZN3_9BASI|nr:uncharacterized protein VP01_315g7 [Puccinia sorghi]